MTHSTPSPAHQRLIPGHRWFREPLIFIVAALLCASSAWAQQARYFTYEYTRQTGQFIDFYNLTDTAQTVTVDIYNPDGSSHSTQSVVLRGYESLTQTDPSVSKAIECTT